MSFNIQADNNRVSTYMYEVKYMLKQTWKQILEKAWK